MSVPAHLIELKERLERNNAPGLVVAESESDSEIDDLVGGSIVFRIDALSAGRLIRGFHYVAKSGQTNTVVEAYRESDISKIELKEDQAWITVFGPEGEVQFSIPLETALAILVPEAEREA